MKIAIFPAIYKARLIVCMQKEGGNTHCYYSYSSDIKEAIEYLKKAGAVGWPTSVMAKEEKESLEKTKWHSLEEINALLALNPNYFKGGS